MASLAHKAVLATLRNHGEGWMAATRLAARSGVDPALLERVAADLSAEGYEIERRAGKGYRFVGCADRLIAAEIARELDTGVIGGRIVSLARTASTNDVAWQEALADESEGTVVFAEEQTTGRGRMGRAWWSPAGSGVLMSVVLRPQLQVGQSHILTAMASVAVAQALREHLPIPARIRWPNDVFIADRKVAGILVEGRTLATGASFVVGIGLNVNGSEADLPPELIGVATSLAIAVGHALDRIEVARWLLRSLERWYRDLRSGDMGRIANHWRQLSSTLGHRVLLVENGHDYRGTVLDVSLEDGLIVRLDEGLTRIFRPASVTLRHLPETQ